MSAADRSLDQLIAEYYDDLRQIAERRLRRERNGGPTPTSLAHEATTRLLKQENQPESREHFLAIASTIMSRLLIDRARARRNDARALDDDHPPAASPVPESASPHRLVRALEELSSGSPRAAEVLTMHAILGLPLRQVARALGVSIPTVERDLRFARAWIASRLPAEVSS